ncbi:hypothetical protein ACRALDRAFT_211176 [Sodiomyces alcalophilus JCM 7366]|uniref:uncharacterized protein n=1 Tax=Sodiomyces alcalophilus JCM 7366 TaxID=591952 RepID=UPI0039B58612
MSLGIDDDDNDNNDDDDDDDKFLRNVRSYMSRTLVVCGSHSTFPEDARKVEGRRERKGSGFRLSDGVVLLCIAGFEALGKNFRTKGEHLNSESKKSAFCFSLILKEAIMGRGFGRVTPFGNTRLHSAAFGFASDETLSELNPVAPMVATVCSATVCSATVCSATVCSATVCSATVCSATVCSATVCSATVCSATVCSANPHRPLSAYVIDTPSHGLQYQFTYSLEEHQ